MNPADALAPLRAIAAEAAELIASVYRTAFEVEYKKPRDPVTIADKRANELICQRLEQHFPGVPVVAEESSPGAFAGFHHAPFVFFVDPLDGTREFVKRNDEFVVMIGLLGDTRPILGVMHEPATGHQYWGGVGVQAQHCDAAGAAKPLRVSSVARLGDSSVVSTRSHRSAELEAALNALGVARLDALGSAGLKCAAVARGSAEAYVAPGYAGSRWDLCAGEAIITAAGGRVTDAGGLPIDYRNPVLTNDRGIIASNGVVHDEIVSRLAAAGDRAG